MLTLHWWWLILKSEISIYDRLEKSERKMHQLRESGLPVDNWPLPYLDGAQLLVVCAWEAEAVLLPVAPGTAWAQAVRGWRDRGGPWTRLVNHWDLHAVCLEGLLVHKLVVLHNWEKGWGRRGETTCCSWITPLLHRLAQLSTERKRFLLLFFNQANWTEIPVLKLFKYLKNESSRE